MLKRALALLAFAVLVFTGTAARAETVLKIATLAPDGSSWMKQFRDWGSKIEQRSTGGIKVKFFAGGVSGDEPAMVKKLRLGQLEGAAMTGVGLGLIQPEVRVLDIPFFFKDAEELLYVRNTLETEFRKKFEDKGYIHLGWIDVGPVQIFTNTSVQTVAELRLAKLWRWSDDPVMGALLSQLSVNGEPMGVPDVLPGLQSARINACYGSPLAVLTLKWNSKVKYVMSMVLAQSVGAIVVAKNVWNRLTPDQQSILRDESKQLSDRLARPVRVDNEKAAKKMQALGLQVAPTPEETIKEFRAQAQALRTKLDGKVWTKEWRLRVEQVLAGKK